MAQQQAHVWRVVYVWLSLLLSLSLAHSRQHADTLSIPHAFQVLQRGSHRIPKEHRVKRGMVVVSTSLRRNHDLSKFEQ